MPNFRADVDIDFPPNFNPKALFPTWARASLLKNEQLTQHPCGIYPQNIAVDTITGLAAIPYEEAEQLGYFKLDCLSNHVFANFQSRAEILELLKLEPDWSILTDKDQVEKLFQISKHYDLMLKLKPQSIMDLADAIALIRPGKSKLIPLYLAQKEAVRKSLYSQSEEFSFKKSHSISYAMVIMLQLHLIELGLL